MKVVICWTGISGYMVAAWRALASVPGIDLHVIAHPMGKTSAPFASEIMAGISYALHDEEKLSDISYLGRLVAEQKPDIVVICGWVLPSFSKLPFVPALSSCKFIMGMDTPINYSLRQRMARLKLGKYFDRLDAVFVAGERAWQLARNYLGIPEEKINRGMYGIDYARLAPLHAQRLAAGNWPRRFLYMGRYSPVKGIDTLIAAYKDYRRRASDPWELICCGSGEDKGLLAGVSGLEDKGFVQPADQLPIILDSGAFVLASRFDPWPLVVVEACAAGLPVLCTEACGSAVELVRPAFSGLTVAGDNPAALAEGMLRLHNSYDQLPEMGRRARDFAAAYAADIWAQRWTYVFGKLMNQMQD